MTSADIDLRQELEKYFGFDQFKGDQEEIVKKRAGWQRHLCDHADRWG